MFNVMASLPWYKGPTLPQSTRMYTCPGYSNTLKKSHHFLYSNKVRSQPRITIDKLVEFSSTFLNIHTISIRVEEWTTETVGNIFIKAYTRSSIQHHCHSVYNEKYTQDKYNRIQSMDY